MMLNMNRIGLKRHWEQIYENTREKELGWYEEVPTTSLSLIRKYNPCLSSRFLIVGAGTSHLPDCLLELGYEDIIVTDISSHALSQLRKRLPKDLHKHVTFVVDDLLFPRLLTGFAPVQFWHDRAVLHFFVKEEDRQAYFSLLRQMLAPGGLVFFAEYNLQGAKMSYGLPVMNFNAEMLSEALGREFEMVTAFDYIHHTPFGEPRPFVYGLWRRLEG